MTEISWKPPWHPVVEPSEIEGLQTELEKEVGPQHPLWMRGARVIGRRQDNDSIVVRLNDDSLVEVHLVWHGKVDQFPSQYPWIHRFGTAEDFQRSIDEEAPDFTE